MSRLMDSAMRSARRLMVAAAGLLIPSHLGAAQSGALDLGDARIHYETAGQGPAVVLIHGWALNLREWDDQVAALKARYRVVALDRRGYGKSTGHADASADPGDIRSLMDTLGIGTAVLVGHSAGAQVVLRFAQAFPERATGLVLYGAGLPPLGFPIPRSAPRPDPRPIARQYGRDSLRKFILGQPGFTTLRTPEVEARIKAMWDTYNGKDLLEDHPPSGRYPLPQLEAVRGWTTPVLFVTGENEEPYTSLVADSLARWMPNARRVVVPGGGHGVHFQQPERFNAALVAFLAGLSGK